MSFKQLAQTAAHEPRYGPDTLRRVTALATRLQSQHRETLTAREIEAIGTEVGLEPAAIRDALAQIHGPSPAVTQGHSYYAGLSSGLPLAGARGPEFQARLRHAQVVGWWAAGWTLPLIFVLVAAAAHLAGPLTGAAYFVGWAVYLAGGILLSMLSKGSVRELRSNISRTTLLDLLFVLQRELEGQKVHRAFLSIDVVGSAEMKRSAPELEAEYSFRHFASWVQAIVQADGGQMQSAAGDGMMCVFATEAGALRAARQLQQSLPQFNREHNRLPLPFRVRCGVSAGEVAVDGDAPLGQLQSPVIDRAAALQKRAAPGDILVSAEMAGVAMAELAGVVPVKEPVAGETALSWRPAQDPAALCAAEERNVEPEGLRPLEGGER